jgi:hypothetical protein
MRLDERKMQLFTGRVTRAITKKRNGERTPDDIDFLRGNREFRTGTTYLYRMRRGEWRLCVDSSSRQHSSFEEAAKNASVVYTYSDKLQRLICARLRDGDVLPPDYRGFSHTPLDA